MSLFRANEPLPGRAGIRSVSHSPRGQWKISLGYTCGRSSGSHPAAFCVEILGDPDTGCTLCRNLAIDIRNADALLEGSLSITLDEVIFGL